MSTVSLTIDYSNGAQKHFARIPWSEGLTILGAIESSQGMTPGTTVTFGSDRSGHALGLVIDGVPHDEQKESEWVVWVNEEQFGRRLGTDTSFRFHPDQRQENLLEPGDHVLLKLTRGTDRTA